MGVACTDPTVESAFAVPEIVPVILDRFKPEGKSLVEVPLEKLWLGDMVEVCAKSSGVVQVLSTVLVGEAGKFASDEVREEAT